MSSLISQKLSKLVERVEECEGRILDLESELEKKDKVTAELQKKLGHTKNQTDAQRAQYDELHQYGRRNNLRIFGIKEKKNENTDQIVLETAKKLGVQLSLAEIDRSHRTGKPKSQHELDMEEQQEKKQQHQQHTQHQQPSTQQQEQQQQQPPSRETLNQQDATKNTKTRHRPILVKFTSYRSRQALIVNRKVLKDSGVSISEDLIPQKLDLLRKTYRSPLVQQAWSSDGKIIALLKATNGKRITKLISTEADLKNIPEIKKT